MADLKNTAPILVTIALSAALAGCGKADTHTATAGETDRLCGAIIIAGYTKQCAVNKLDSTIGIVIDTDDEKARNLCADIASKMKPTTADLSDKWRLQIFSPYRDDKPLAACFLH
ncbi:MAG: hypothetical protein WCA63_02320 [Gallionella sp.]